jgi:hypothetical protein
MTNIQINAGLVNGYNFIQAMTNILFYTGLVTANILLQIYSC